MKTVKWIAILLLTAAYAPAATKVLVTVTDPKTGAPVTGLGAGDFTVVDDKTPRKVEAAEFTRDNLDIILLVDSSLAGEMVRPIAADFVQELEPKEQMALVAYHSSADMLQDFTSSRQLLLRAIAGIKFGNEPLVLDAAYAAISGGFQSTPFRRVVLLVTSGLEGYSRTKEQEVIRLARRNQVSIFPAYAMGGERALFESLARQTGGASFNLGDMRRTKEPPPAKRVFETIRGHYTLTVAGNLALGEKLKVEVRKGLKAQVSALPLE